MLDPMVALAVAGEAAPPESRARSTRQGEEVRHVAAWVVRLTVAGRAGDGASSDEPAGRATETAAGRVEHVANRLPTP